MHGVLFHPLFSYSVNIVSKRVVFVVDFFFFFSQNFIFSVLCRCLTRLSLSDHFLYSFALEEFLRAASESKVCEEQEFLSSCVQLVETDVFDKLLLHLKKKELLDEKLQPLFVACTAAFCKSVPLAFFVPSPEEISTSKFIGVFEGTT